MRKLYHRIVPYEEHKGQAGQVLQTSIDLISQAILTGVSLRSTLQEAIGVFNTIATDESHGRKPRIGLLGDIYVKFNEVINQGIVPMVEELGGELIIPSLTEYQFHFYDADIRLNGQDPRRFRLL